MLEHLVARLRQHADADDRDLAQHGVELGLEQQVIAEPAERPQQALAARQHPEDVHRRIADLGERLLRLGLQRCGFGVRDAGHGEHHRPPARTMGTPAGGGPTVLRWR